MNIFENGKTDSKLNHSNTEITILRQLKKGDVKAFDALYSMYSSKLYSFALKALKSSSLAEEILQEVFIKVWEKRYQIDTSRSFQSFIFTISYNLIKDHYKKKLYADKYLQEIAVEALYSDNTKSNQLSYQQIITRLNRIITQLPEKRRNIFLMSKQQGLTNKEIADHLTITEQTVKNQLVISLKFIRDHLNEEEFKDLLFFLFLHSNKELTTLKNNRR
ncbi:RNA polymerase sigma-70 factor [Prolixibacteraceae bacterium JC049]|nr:RNA polymerase sigma-70 factor [Prolixibacteraceae bacterium JC049]